MKIKDLLLNGNSFSALLDQFSLKADDIKIQDEEMIISGLENQQQEARKENICIEGKNQQGVVNFFGTLHYNIPNQLAVFEMHGYERVS
jgi:hypothetical protein